MLKLSKFKFQQNSRNRLFFYLLHCIMYVYRHMRKNNKPVRSQNLTSRKILFKKCFIWLVWGNSFLKQLFRTLYSLYIMITIFQEKDYIYQTTYLKGGGGGNLPLHPHFRRKWGAPDPLRPSLDIGLGMIYIIILHYA